MKRTGSVCLLLALVAGAFAGPADAARRTPRKATRTAVATYGMPWLSSPSTGRGCFGDGCARFDLSESERWVTMEVRDESGAPSAFRIAQRTGSGSGTATVGGPFCGSSGEAPVRLTPGVDVVVYVYASGDTVCPGSVGTSGTVEAMFSNVP